jgi:hypothetical protein
MVVVKEKNKSDYIREVLAKDIDLPAGEIVEKLHRRGVVVNAGLVYVVRAKLKQEMEAEDLKQKEAELKQKEAELKQKEAELKQKEAEGLKTNQKEAEGLKTNQKEEAWRQKRRESQMLARKNEKPLRKYVLEVLSETSEPLTRGQIGERCRSKGYQSSEESFRTWMGKVMKALTEEELVQKDTEEAGPNTLYSLIMENNGVVPTVLIPTSSGIIETEVEVTRPTVLDSQILIEMGRISHRLGGVDNLAPYIYTLKELESVK